MSRHVSAVILARRKEGALSTRQAARIDAHMLACARCARTDSDLAAVSSLLAAVQLPGMPSSFIQRVQIAIADESTARAALSADTGTGTLAAEGPDAAADSSPGDRGAPEAGDGAALIPGRPDLPTRSRRPRRSRRFRLPSLTSPLVLRGLAGAAAVIVVAGAGFLLANGQQQPRSTSSGIKSNPTAKAAAPAALSHASSVSVHYQLQGKTATTTAFVSKANFERSSLAGLARSDVQRTARLAPSPTNSKLVTTMAGQSVAQAFDVGRLESCLSQANAGRTVVAATIARFLGKRATLIVFHSLQSAAFLDVAIVGPACSASNLHLIYQTTIPAG